MSSWTKQAAEGDHSVILERWFHDVFDEVKRAYLMGVMTFQKEAVKIVDRAKKDAMKILKQHPDMLESLSQNFHTAFGEATQHNEDFNMMDALNDAKAEMAKAAGAEIEEPEEANSVTSSWTIQGVDTSSMPSSIRRAIEAVEQKYPGACSAVEVNNDDDFGNGKTAYWVYFDAPFIMGVDSAAPHTIHESSVKDVVRQINSVRPMTLDEAVDDYQREQVKKYLEGATNMTASWTITAAQDIQYRFDAGISLVLNTKDVKDSSKVQEILRMNVSNEEKLRQLTSNEKQIISDAAQEKYNAVSKYAESQGLKMNIDSTGDPEGSIDWHDVLGEETTLGDSTAPVVESGEPKAKENEVQV